MTIVRTGDEVAVFDPTPEAEAYLSKLTPQGAKLGHTRAWAEAKPGFIRCSLSALAHVKALV